MSSGVPQGSHLGPLLFLLFINDIVKCFPDVKVLLFADDLKIFLRVRTVRDCVMLQKAADQLLNWCDKNKLFLNVSKCNVVRFHRIKSPILFEYKLNDAVLSSQDTVRDLGVYLDKSLSFEAHINHVSNKALRMLGFIKNIGSDFTSLRVFHNLYFSFVRSSLEFCSPVWSPTYATHVKALETVQHKYLRFLAFKFKIPFDRFNCNYDLLQDQFEIETLEKRRVICDLKALYKCLNHQILCPELRYEFTSNFYVANRETRARYLFYAASTPRTN